MILGKAFTLLIIYGYQFVPRKSMQKANFKRHFTLHVFVADQQIFPNGKLVNMFSVALKAFIIALIEN